MRRGGPQKGRKIVTKIVTSLSLYHSSSLLLFLYQPVPFCRFHIFIFINFRPKELGYVGQQFWNLIANHVLLIRFLCVIY